MFTRSKAGALLLICTSMALAQEVSTPTTSSEAVTGGQNAGSPAASSLIVPTSGTSMDIPVNTLTTPFLSGTEMTPAPSQEEKPKPAEEEKESFSLPGGFGFVPVNFTPGQGKFDRKPLSFGTTLQQGFDDNIYSSSGQTGQSPRKGSTLTNLSQSMDLLLVQSRFGLSVDANIGAQYYWNRTGDKLTPSGGLDLLFAYKLTPRAQFSAIINGAYTTQSSLSVLNGLIQSQNSAYLQLNGKFDLVYRWTPRFSTDTIYAWGTVQNADSTGTSSNHVNQTVGQSFRYGFSRLFTGVVEGRFEDTTYDDNSANSNTYFALVGGDLTLSRQLVGTLRVGDSTQDRHSTSTSTPYFEGSLSYNATKRAVFALNGRYGFDNTSSTGDSRKSLRTGLSLNYALSLKLRATASVNYSTTNYKQDSTTTTTSTDDAYSTSLGLQYSLNQNLLIFTNWSWLQSIPADTTQKYTKNTYYLGLTYQY